MKKKLIGSILSLILTLLVLISAAYAWYSTNINTSTSGIQITTDKDLQIFNMNIYKYNSDLETGVEVDISAVDAFNMPEYDSIFIQNNHNTSIILMLSIYSSRILANEQLTITINCSNSSTNSNILSNIVNFDVGIIPENILGYNETPANIYAISNEYFAENINELSFLTRNNNQLNKVQTLTFTLSNYLNYLYNDYLRFFIKIDYDEDLIHYFSTNNAYIDAELSNTVTLVSDLTSIVIN